MIGFNALLEDEGVDPQGVKLARHQVEGRRSPYELWLGNDGRFELYQRIQRRTVFEGAHLLASFVVTPLDETLFVGLFSIDGIEKAPEGVFDPLSDRNVTGWNLYSLAPFSALADYRGRLIVKWGLGFRTWVQRADKQDKEVLEIRRDINEPPFPGFLDFRERLSALATVPISWRTALSSVSGVYLLSCPESGRQYVGSACGQGGFWGRWQEYVASGHGGNRRMRDVPISGYQVTVLEVASSSAGMEAIVAMENRWKEKLLTRAFGLNAN